VKRYVLFLNGAYRTEDLLFYKKISRGAVRIAVDGGHAYFEKVKRPPDLVIGDLDSARNIPRKLFEQGKVLLFPKDKDKTDTQLALDYAIKAGAKEIDLVMPSMTEPDHVLGAMMLLVSTELRSWLRKGGKVRLLNRTFEMYYLRGSAKTISGAKGDRLSVVPLTDIKLSCSGTEYKCRNQAIKRGDSRPLRNRISSVRATVRVAGEAFVFRLFSQSSNS
jgi:thiamine pyrophosphokinase